MFATLFFCSCEIVLHSMIFVVLMFLALQVFSVLSAGRGTSTSISSVVLDVTSLLLYLLLSADPFNFICCYSLHSLDSFCCLRVVHVEHG